MILIDPIVEIGPDLHGEIASQEEQLVETKKNKKTIRRIAAMPWVFAGIGFIVTALVVLAVVLLEYKAMTNTVNTIVEERAATVLTGAISSITSYNDGIESETHLYVNTLSKIGNSTSSSPLDLINSMNTSLWQLLVPDTVASVDNMGYIVSALGPPDTNYPEQDIAAQGYDCLSICRRPGDPLFTTIAEFGFIKDRIVGVADEEFRLMSPDNGISEYNSSFHAMFLVNRTTPTAPSWASNKKDDAVITHRIIERGQKFRVSSTLVLFQNGSSFAGIWNPVAVTTSPEGHSYYFLAFRQSFIHPLNNLTIIVTNLVTVFTYQEVLTAFAKQVGGDNGHLMLVDRYARVISYNKDPYGDSRLANCTIEVVPGAENRPCENFYGKSHPSPFIQRLFQNYHTFIMSRDDSLREVWLDDEGTRYLFAAKPILTLGGTRLMALFILREEDVAGTLKRDTIVIVVFSGVFIGVACIVLSFAGFMSLYRAQKSVLLAAKLAACISRYDLDEAVAVIDHHLESQWCFKKSDPISLQFVEIIDNLRVYRPFLPSALLVQRGRKVYEDSNGDLASASKSTSANTSISTLPRSSRTEFKQFTGSLLIVDLGNLPIPTHVSKHNANQDGILVNKFLSIAIDIVQQHGGVTEVVRANQLLVSFNCHSRVTRHEDIACRCALSLRRALGSGSTWCGHRMNVAISITTGHGLVGSAGSSFVKARMLAGEPVDLIRKLPALQRELGISILMTESTAQGLSEGVVRVPVDVIAPTWWQTGRSPRLKVYELLGNAVDINPAQKLVAKSRLTVFVYLHVNRSPEEALKYIKSLSSTDSSTFHIQLLANLCRHVLKISNQNQPRLLLPSIKKVAVLVPSRRETSWEELEGTIFFDGAKIERVKALRPQQDILLESFISPAVQLTIAHQDQATRQLELYDFFEGAPDTVVGDDGNGHNDTSQPGFGSGDSLERSMPLFSMFVKKDRLSITMPPEQERPPPPHVLINGPLSPHDDHTPSSHQPDAFDESTDHLTTITSGNASSLPPQHPAPPLSGGSEMLRSSQGESRGQSKSSAAGQSSSAQNRVVRSVYGDRYFPTNKSLGEGAFGHVVLALHETGGLVAMKQIPLNALQSGVEPLIQEMELLSSFNHPNIASYVTCAVNKRDNTFCIMTEYLAAGSLYDLIISTNHEVPHKAVVTNQLSGPRVTFAKGSMSLPSSCPTYVPLVSSLPVKTVINYAREMINGLHYLHTRSPPILHLDVKPQNVLMTAEGSCKLIDFGTSKFFSEADKSMSVRGTPRYMAPEAALGEFSPASDIYSLGISLLHMLMGRPPWDHVHGDDNSFMMRLARDTTLRPEIPEWIDRPLRSLLQLCTSRDPKARPTAKELLSRIDRMYLDDDQDINGDYDTEEDSNACLTLGDGI